MDQYEFGQMGDVKGIAKGILGLTAGMFVVYSIANAIGEVERSTFGDKKSIREIVDNIHTYNKKMVSSLLYNLTWPLSSVF